MIPLTKREIINIKLAMGLAENGASYSKCIRRKVGAVIITPEEGFYLGVNGTLPNTPNVCEITLPDGSLETTAHTIHAEANALDKMHKDRISANQCIAVQTTSPCIGCMTRMLNSGVRMIIYRDTYRVSDHLTDYQEKGICMSYNQFLERYDNHLQ